MSRLAGVTFERDIHGQVKKVTLDMKYHAQSLEDYLDAKPRLKSGAFIT